MLMFGGCIPINNKQHSVITDIVSCWFHKGCFSLWLSLLSLCHMELENVTWQNHNQVDRPPQSALWFYKGVKPNYLTQHALFIQPFLSFKFCHPLCLPQKLCSCDSRCGLCLLHFYHHHPGSQPCSYSFLAPRPDIHPHILPIVLPTQPNKEGPKFVVERETKTWSALLGRKREEGWVCRWILRIVSLMKNGRYIAWSS